MSKPQRQSRFDRRNDLVVMKFGGTSVEDVAAIRRLIAIVQNRKAAHAVVVVSALANVTDQLLEAGKAAEEGHLGAALDLARRIYVRHEQLADALVEGPASGRLDRELRDEFRSLEDLLRGVEVSRQLDLQAQDRLLGFGECFSSGLVQESLYAAGVNAIHVDARSCIATDARHGQANPLWEATNQRIQDNLTPYIERGEVPVLGGFIASTSDGVPTTLGRGGSDFSAAILAAALCASGLEIWTDVDGIMTADPKLCPQARVIHRMTFDEAAELANSGAKVLHPATLLPAMRENIPVYVLNSRRPEGKGTEITARGKSTQAVSSIAVKRNVASVEIESPNGINRDMLNAVYDAFDQHFCAVDVMATSIERISMVAGSAAALPAIADGLSEKANVRWENHKALVCLVGENIRRQADIVSRALAAVSDPDVQVACPGASDRSLSFLVDESKVEESVQRLHQLFFAQKEPARDWGGISSAFCEAG